MKLYYEGIDIYKDVSINSVIHDMYAGGQSDRLTVRFNDTKGTWDKWSPEAGQIIAFETSSARTGRMYVHTIQPENGLLTLRAMSTPASIETKRSKAWEKVTLFKLAKEIATRHSLNFDYIKAADRTYEYVLQKDENDFVFLHQKAAYEKCFFIVFDRTLYLISETYLEAQTPIAVLPVNSKRRFTYEHNTAYAFGKCEIKSGIYSGSFTEPSGINPGRVYHRSDVPVNSNEEASRFAAGILRQANRNCRRGWIHYDLLTQVAAGSIITLETDSQSKWDGKAYIYHLRNDYIRGKSKIFFRMPLESY